MPYSKLADALAGAYTQASQGKGKIRHATDEPFDQQKICVITRWISDSPVAGVLFQGIKKAVESSRLPKDSAIRELQGAINYLAAGIILLEEQQSEPEFDLVTWANTDTIEEVNEKLKAELDQRLFSEPSCTDCTNFELPQDEMPCKKCFNLSFKPHFEREQ